MSSAFQQFRMFICVICWTETVSYNGFDYYIEGTEIVDLPNFLRFDASRTVCVDWGGKLASIRSREESDFLKSHLYENCS